MNISNQDILTQKKIREIAYGFQASRILLTAFELEIFTILDKHLLTAEEISFKINCNLNSTKRLLNALVGLGLLKKVKNKFYNSDAASNFLVKGKNDFIGGLYHTNEIWKNWNNLTDIIKTGKPELAKKDIIQKEYFIAAMHFRALKESKILASMLDLDNITKMLDVGGGSGIFSMAFIEKNKNIFSTIFDLPEIIQITQKYVNEFIYKENIILKEGNYLFDDFDSNYDLIFLSSIIHINSYEQNMILIKKCCDSLNNNGQIIIKDWIMNDEKTEPTDGAIFSINMLVSTEFGDVYSEKEIKEWFYNAGIKKIEKKTTSFGWDLLIGYKS
ncbi:MAG: acetylserotonin O-methyltransferase [Melioribacteraceae bacterium]|nr:acetylserotonin O-methyltransferase [Melioribacteraceae bacterium]